MNMFVETLEDRSLFSVSVAGFGPAAAPLAGPVVSAAAAVLPSLVGRYSGVFSAPAIGHNLGAVLTITKQLANGSFTGTMVAGGVSVPVTGTVKANKTFTVTLKGNHSGGPINATGTGKIDPTGKKLAISLTFNAGGTKFPGTINVSKA